MFSSHAQLVGAFNKQLVATGILQDDLARSLRELFELRQAADYDVSNSIEEGEAEKALERSRDFVDRVIAHARANHPNLFGVPE